MSRTVWVAEDTATEVRVDFPVYTRLVLEHSTIYHRLTEDGACTSICFTGRRAEVDQRIVDLDQVVHRGLLGLDGYATASSEQEFLGKLSEIRALVNAL